MVQLFELPGVEGQYMIFNLLEHKRIKTEKNQEQKSSKEVKNSNRNFNVVATFEISN